MIRGFKKALHFSLAQEDFLVGQVTFKVHLPNWQGKNKIIKSDMLHGMIRNNNFERKTALQYWNNVATVRNNAATMMQHCVALKIIVANCLV